eukprot:scaffold33602_cov26-Tisochrysis_lutea.AAC.4
MVERPRVTLFEQGKTRICVGCGAAAHATRHSRRRRGGDERPRTREREREALGDSPVVPPEFPI